ncbi:MAG: CbiX/SirB N-terminal domain-containing protein [Euryarchaeota archaeon]|nr:CbiX/SirB N-terminal domain-containing protein [Euryarchaeota archaeon]
MNETKRKNAVVVLTCILLLGVLTLSTGVANAEDSNLSEQITAEELFERLSGNWSFNGTMTIGEQAMPTIGTRTVSLTGPTTADFVVVMDGEEGAETGEAWWDADKEKFAIKEGDEEPLYYDLLPNGYGSSYDMDGLPELGILENVTCEESETFVDDNTTVKTWTAKNTTGIVVAEWEGTFTRIKEAPVEEYEQIGILVVGHGSPSDSWCAPLRSVVANVSSPYPIELGFLEFVPNETINIAVGKLDEAGVTKIIAVPLFISSHSGHIGEIEYVLGLREELTTMSMQVFVEGKELERSIVSLEGRYRVSYMPIVETVSAMGVTAKQHHGGGEAEEEELVPVDTETEIVLTNAIDDHWAIADILVDRAAALSEDPANETIVLVAHGTGNESNFAGWVSSSKSLAEQMKLKLRYGMGLNINDVRYSFVFPNETLHSDLLVRAVVENVSATSHSIVVPLMVSEGYFTGRKIPKLLKNISYAYPEKGERALTPHSNVAEWIELMVAKELSYPSVQIYDGEELLTITIEDAGKYHGEGVVEICPCVASAFKSTLRAFSEEELWNGTPHRGDVKINSGHPSDGHMMTFEYILGSTEDLTIDEGADIVNITADNYGYTFTRKSTNDSITLRVEEEIFPERFFELRTKCKLAKMGKGDVTKEEKKAFKLLWRELKEKLMYLPVDSIFEESN